MLCFSLVTSAVAGTADFEAAVLEGVNLGFGKAWDPTGNLSDDVEHTDADKFSYNRVGNEFAVRGAAGSHPESRVGWEFGMGVALVLGAKNLRAVTLDMFDSAGDSVDITGDQDRLSVVSSVAVVVDAGPTFGRDHGFNPYVGFRAGPTFHKPIEAEFGDGSAGEVRFKQEIIGIAGMRVDSTVPTSSNVLPGWTLGVNAFGGHGEFGYNSRPTVDQTSIGYMWSFGGGVTLQPPT